MNNKTDKAGEGKAGYSFNPVSSGDPRDDEYCCRINRDSERVAYVYADSKELVEQRAKTITDALNGISAAQAKAEWVDKS